MEAQTLRAALQQKQGDLIEAELAAAAATRAAEAGERARREERASWKWRLDEQVRLAVMRGDRKSTRGER